jgi:hypothetical protein
MFFLREWVDWLLVNGAFWIKKDGPKLQSMKNGESKWHSRKTIKVLIVLGW